MYGLAMVLFTAGVQKIPQSLYDAARMDGAGPVREFFAVTLPGLRNEIAVALTLTTIQALRSFDLVYITTGGGPGDATSVPAFEVYNRAFSGGDVGTASAIGVCIAALIFVLTLLHQPDRRARGGAMIDRREQALTYALLGVFSLIALVPIVGILLTALQAPGEVANFGAYNGAALRQLRDGVGRGQLLPVPALERDRRRSASSCSRRCSRSWPATRSG